MIFKYLPIAPALAAMASVVIFDNACAEVRVVDGDTIVVDGIVHRIHGIDAPEVGQECKKADGSRWACGKLALQAMEKLVLPAVHLLCNDQGLDGYGRTLSVCYADGRDIGQVLVRSGLAWSFRKYSNDYDNDEDAARALGAGVWQADSETPWEFRQHRWDAATQQAPDSRCPIKGNISSKGERIYHAPWSPWYDKTKVDLSHGERWFCTEAEAHSAGWRAPFWGRGR